MYNCEREQNAHDSGINSMAIRDFEVCEDPSVLQREPMRIFSISLSLETM